MDELDKTIIDLFEISERNFENDPISSFGARRRRIPKFLSRENISIAAMFLLLVISLWAFAIPDILYDGVAYSMEVFTRQISSFYYDLSID